MAVPDADLVGPYIKFNDWVVLVQPDLHSRIRAVLLAVVLERELGKHSVLEVVDAQGASRTTVSLGMRLLWTEDCCTASGVVEALIGVIVPEFKPEVIRLPVLLLLYLKYGPIGGIVVDILHTLDIVPYDHSPIGCVFDPWQHLHVPVRVVSLNHHE